MKNVFSRLLDALCLKRETSVGRITFGLNLVQVPTPISIDQRDPLPSEYDSRGRCLYGRWDNEDGRWVFGLDTHPELTDTHFLPANSEVLPGTIMKPAKRERDKRLPPPAVVDWLLAQNRSPESFSVQGEAQQTDFVSVCLQEDVLELLRKDAAKRGKNFANT